MMNPNCTEEMTWLTMSAPKSNFLVSDSNIAFPANQVEVQANCERIMMGRICSFCFNRLVNKSYFDYLIIFHFINSYSFKSVAICSNRFFIYYFVSDDDSIENFAM